MHLGVGLERLAVHDSFDDSQAVAAGSSEKTDERGVVDWRRGMPDIERPIVIDKVSALNGLTCEAVHQPCCKGEVNVGIADEGHSIAR